MRGLACCDLTQDTPLEGICVKIPMKSGVATDEIAVFHSFDTDLGYGVVVREGDG